MLSKSLITLALAASIVGSAAGHAAEHPATLVPATLAPATLAPATLAPATLAQNAAVTTDLGADASAVTYWVATAEGWNVVTTVDSVTPDESDTGQARHAVVRFSALLQPGQSQLISVPEPVGSPSQELRIRRLGDRIDVSVIRTQSAPNQREAVN